MSDFQVTAKQWRHLKQDLGNRIALVDSYGHRDGARFNGQFRKFRRKKIGSDFTSVSLNLLDHDVVSFPVRSP